MKRSVVFAAAALALGAFVLVPVGVAGRDNQGPPCTDITGDPMTFAYVLNSDGSGTVSGTQTMAAPACDVATYTFFVLDEAGSAELVPPTTVEGSSVSGSSIPFTITVPGDLENPAPTIVCFRGESYYRGRLNDNAPDTGCIVLDSGSSGGGGNYA
jgi:hypothetical protein